METGIDFNFSDVFIKILIGLNLPGSGKIFFMGGGYHPWFWCLPSKHGEPNWLMYLILSLKSAVATYWSAP
jgi:hypothetical protein